MPGDLFLPSGVSASGYGFYGKFSTTVNGSVSNINVTSAGAGFSASDLSNAFISLVYAGTQLPQDGTISNMKIDAFGSNYVPGDVMVTGSQGSGFVASFSVSKGNGSLERWVCFKVCGSRFGIHCQLHIISADAILQYL